MKNKYLSHFKFKTAEEMLEEHKRFNMQREMTFKKNQLLIKQWRSVPWWKFWQKPPSFEEQRAIILSNWGMFEANRT